MAKTLLIVNGIEISSSIISPFKIGRHKLWSGDDTGRDMDGLFDGTLIGIFPKITAIIHPKNEQELGNICKELDKAEQTIQYYNPITHQLANLGSYTNDYDINMVDASDPENYYDSITVSFITKRKE